MSHYYKSKKTGLVYPSITTVLPDFPWGDEEARGRGTHVHKACKIINDGQELDWSTVADKYVPYVKAYELLLKETKFVPERSEMVVESHRHKSAGTLDITGELYGHKIIADIKTGEYSKKLPYWECQLSAYYEFYKETTGDKKKRKLWVFVLRKDGTYRPFEMTEKDAFTVFLSYLRVFKWEERWK